MGAEIKILYLEQAHGEAEIAGKVLKQADINCDIVAAVHQQGFHDALTNYAPDIIIADDANPALSAIDALKLVKQAGLAIPLIVVANPPTAIVVETVVNMMKHGADDCILKENIITLPAIVLSAIKNHQTETGVLLDGLHEAALKRLEANLSAIIENTSDLVYSLDTNLKFITFNQLFKTTMMAVYGFHIEQGTSILNLITEFNAEMAEKWKGIYMKTLAGETLQFVNEYPVKDGSVFLSYSMNPIRETGKVIGLSCFSRDITAQKLMEIEREKITTDLLQRNKALEQFTYIISHNLRAPVANIIGLSSLIGGMEFEDPEVFGIVNNIGQSAHKLDEVISDLNQVLQVNKAISEHIELILLPELIEDITLSIKHLIEQEEVSIACDFGGVGELYSLKSFMYSIFYNLIQNSIKYRRPEVNPLINISTKVDDEKILIVYNDNGRGIDTSKYANELFGLYKRFDTSVEGKGMGLFMVKMQVESLGGTISLKSVLNKGTEFLLEFPLREMQKTT